ncbi:MAG: UbiA family prenyltransferase [Ignavibacteria bacterium]|nr:UbiA family prenyltransferase [Ignavibacteria bacterium]
MEEKKQTEVVCVDLDYTLISTDLLIEQITSFLKQNPLRIFLILIWLFKSRRFLKKKLSEYVNIDYQNLPYRTETIDYLLEAKRNNNKLLLVTASNQKIADNINNTLQIFDEVYGSNEEILMKGKTKAKFLEEKLGKFNFTYIGDSICDFHIWKISKNAILVSNSRFVQFLLKKQTKNFSGNLLENKTKISNFLKLIRIHQWIKNILIFAPILLAHKFFDFSVWTQSVIAFFAFSLIASSMYILNDIIDIENDRKHPKKKFRPIASGMISFYTAFFISLILLILGFFLSFEINLWFAFVCFLYVLLNFLYSLKIKQLFIFDVFLLSVFYVLRLYAGGLATNIPISNWLLAFSMFFFLSLATLKRFTELKISSNAEGNISGRPYNIDFTNFIQTFGISSSFASVIVFILYINSEKVWELYKFPSLLWIDAFLLLLWLMFIWFFAQKGKVDNDPVMEALKNPYLLAIEFIMIVTWLMAFLL